MHFSSIIFLILALLLINTVSEGITPWIASDWLAFSISLLLYIGLCGVIYLQYYLLKGLFRKRSGLIQILVSVELLVYLIIYQYILDAGRIFQKIPFMQNMQTVNVVWQLLLYLGGLITYYSASFIPSYRPLQQETRLSYGWRQLRLLLPFAIPFVFLTIVMDIFSKLFVPDQSSFMWEEFSIVFSLVLVILLLIFLPYFIQKIWGCKPLMEGELTKRLMEICQRANFKHAGMKTWTIMHDQLTAGIIGVVPKFRYVMFTNRLLRELPPESIEAILVHEIGHNTHRHLLIYPFILSGMIICAGLFFYFFEQPLLNVLEQTNAAYPSIWWDFFNPLFIFSLYAGIIVVYFRFVFGYFSRLFERQADLHIFELNIAPEHMIKALEAVAYTSGGYDTPNWHHFSIKQRIEFLRACKNNPERIQRHHKKVRISLVVFFVLLIFLAIVLILIM